MAVIRVRSTDGNNADDGSTWALAKADIATGADGIDAAGDEIVCASTHSETSGAAAFSAAFAGTAASPTKLLSVSDAADPPTALSTGATIARTSSHSININGFVYVNGFTFTTATGSVLFGAANSISHGVVVENVTCRISGNSVTPKVYFGVGGNLGAGSTIMARNISVRFANAGQGVSIRGARVVINGLTLEAGGTSPTTFFPTLGLPAAGPKGATAFVRNVDLANASADINLVGDVDSAANASFHGVKVPASWSGAYQSGTIEPGGRIEFYGVSSGDEQLGAHVEDYSGTIDRNTTVVRSGGSSDAAAHSYKMTSNANCGYPVACLRGLDMAAWNESVGASKTITVEIVHDSVTALTDADIALEVTALTASGEPAPRTTSDLKADYYAAAANQTSSSESWTTTGMANPNKQKLSVTFTPQEVGPILCRVLLFKPSYTVYHDAKPTIT